ncbi:MAG: ROK family protein [Actinomycetota bacterium]|nr:ROK family protein [Actinomycetota bacterium]
MNKEAAAGTAERLVIGVDTGGTLTRGALVDTSGRIVLRVERPTDVTAGTKGILAVVEELVPQAPRDSIRAVGVGVAGFVDYNTGSVTFSPNLTYDDPQIGEAIRHRTGLPTVVENDANAAAWAERKFGSARGTDHMAFLTLGTGIGSGFIEAGRLVRGLTGVGAEFGHTVVEIDGPQCPCGLRGCIEQLASGTAIARMGREALDRVPDSSILAFAGSRDAVTGEHVGKAAREYDETAREILRRAGRALGIGLSNVANLFDPEIIVLGGAVVRAGEPYLGPARDELVRMTQAQRRRPLRLDVSSLGQDAGLLGAAALASESVEA